MTSVSYSTAGSLISAVVALPFDRVSPYCTVRNFSKMREMKIPYGLTVLHAVAQAAVRPGAATVQYFKSQGGNPPVDPPIFSLSQGGNPPVDPPIFSLSQGGNPPLDPPYFHQARGDTPLWTPRLYGTVGIFEELSATSTSTGTTVLVVTYSYSTVQ